MSRSPVAGPVSDPALSSPRRYRRSASLSHPRGTVRSSELRAPVVAVAELLLVVQGVPARVPVLLPRAAARAALARGPARARSCTGRSSSSSTARPTSARSTPRSPTSTAPGVELATHPEFADLELTDEEWAHVPRRRRAARPRATSSSRTPAPCDPIGLELKLEADLGRVRLRGIIDRLELDENGELVVTDYKTGSVPSELWEAKSLSGVHIYALLCERMLGRRPARVQLFYLSKPEAIIATPTDQSIRGVERKTAAMSSAIATACERDDFRPRPGRLCDFCTFKPYCPAHGGDPLDAAELRGPGTVIAPTALRLRQRRERCLRRVEAERGARSAAGVVASAARRAAAGSAGCSARRRAGGALGRRRPRSPPVRPPRTASNSRPFAVEGGHQRDRLSRRRHVRARRTSTPASANARARSSNVLGGHDAAR